MSKTELPRLAVLIDAENISARQADRLFDLVAPIGHAAVRRLYGDFSNPASRSWADACPRHALLPQQQFVHASGRNSVDIGLVIDAMDLLLDPRIDGFCLVSSDIDFLPLATRIRQDGKLVFGFGAEKTHSAFRQACHRFFVLPAPAKAAPAAPAAAEKPPIASAQAAIALIRAALDEKPGAGGRLTLSELGTRLRALDPGFDQRRYGHAKLADLVRASGAFTLAADKTVSAVSAIRRTDKTAA